MTSNTLLMNIVFLLTLSSSVGCAQKLKQTVTYQSADSALEFEISQTHLRKAQLEKIYYSFENFQLIAQVGARTGTYLHGDFENRSNTTNRLYAKGEFRYGLKHGEWRTWKVDGTLKTVERWRKGKLRKRKHVELSEVPAVVAPPEPHKKKRKSRTPDNSNVEKDDTEKPDQPETKKLTNSSDKKD